MGRYKKTESGNKTKYRDHYCEEIVEHMAQGLSKESFAGKIRVSRSTLYTWFEKYPEFAEAAGVGELASLYWYEKLGNDNLISLSGLSSLNAGAYALMMTNKHGWRSRAKDEAPDTVVNNTNTQVVKLAELSHEEKELRINELIAKRGQK
jgi:hypothetical protein